MTCYCYLVGIDYLKRSLKPLLLSVMNSECGYEIDPAKIPPKETVEDNTVNLLSVSQMFMAKITRSKFTNVPYPVRLLCRQIGSATKERFPHGLYAMVGGLFFLRFVCPALTVPQESGIWDGELSVNAKRALLLITKTLMNLSNGVSFGKKEEYMIPMNEFIESNQENIRNFFDNLLLSPELQDADQKEEEEELKRAEEERLALNSVDFRVLQEFSNYLSEKIEKIENASLSFESEDEEQIFQTQLTSLKEFLKESQS
eukprot:CAMPEP_0201502736 /NCGR_PEP_ID=MMETSP0151_2-20130828/84294_1 /ASSEMBLY_ACC=CAM_ASM_000257 /TAXON_ID=200890 /ORGANISM="Paramoeba atlantica, Strain 621/1 / CCAP 1560/9" /LENGTH=257 /DNA_ID=CAMNT_0047896357 /DNA_START=1874 /DNA_END=2647 /DNA_ORIENTATION=+